MAIRMGAMTRKTGRIQSLGESARFQAIEGIRWHIRNKIGIIVAADANRVECVWPSVIGIAESSRCNMEGAREGASECITACWGTMSKTMMKPMDRQIASSDR